MVKDGYKLTDIGVIPEEWELELFKDISSMHGRIGWQGLKQHEFTFRSDDPFLITGMNFKDGKIRWDEVYHIPSERYNEAKQIQLKIDDILMTKDGTIGKLLYVDNIPYPYKASLNSHLLVFRPKNNRYYPKFLFYQLHYKPFLKHIDLTKSGTTFFGITQESVGKYEVFLPKEKEQKAIAKALSDTDELIDSLQNLIDKKENIKLGTMQQLLTGKKRLKGFTEEWEEKNLGDFLEYEQPTKYLVLNTKYSDSSEVPVLTAGKTFILGYTNEEFGIFDNLPVIIFDDFTTSSKFVNFPFKVKSSAMKMLIPKNSDVNLKFIYEVMQQIKYQVADHKRHWIGEFSNIEILVPKIDEQKAIATILSDMDKEIESLKEKLKKTKAIKEAMMDELLTGKTRLIKG